MEAFVLRFAKLLVLIGPFLISVPLVLAQSSQAKIEWDLFNLILIIGIGVGIVVFGLLFYAIFKFREKPQKEGAQ